MTFKVVKAYYHYSPIVGCSLFLILITFTAIQFPGGSYTENCTLGYSWSHNYLCDIIAIESYNGEWNHCYRIGLAAMICLCWGISMFFFFFPEWLNVKGIWKFIIKWMGLVSMICAMLIFSELHNIMIAISSALALPALFGVFITLYRQRYFKYFYFGVFILVLLLINNVIYYTDFMEHWLPQIQKISVICVILWLVHMNVHFVKMKTV